jgi:hypothetical protein
VAIISVDASRKKELMIQGQLIIEDVDKWGKCREEQVWNPVCNISMFAGTLTGQWFRQKPISSTAFDPACVTASSGALRS